MSEPDVRRFPDVPSLDRIREHLARNGWTAETGDDWTSVWRLPARGLVVALPAREDFVDAAPRIREALRTLAFAEDRSQTELTADLTVPGGADTLSVRLTPEGAPSGTAPLALAQSAVRALHDFVVGSATALDFAGLVLPPRRPLRAESYANQTLISTAPGSFIVNLALPLLETPNSPPPPTSSTGDEQQPLVEVAPQPYGRRVVERMRSVVQRGVALAAEVGAGDRMIRAFAEGGRAAANATELAALASLGGPDRGRYQVRFTEARRPEQEPVLPAVVSVTPAHQQVFAEAADYLRSKQPRAGVTVQGLVVRLAQAAPGGPGEITVHGEGDDSGQLRKYRMELFADDYSEALRAHGEGLHVFATGDLEFAGVYNWLRRVTNFAVLPGMD